MTEPSVPSSPLPQSVSRDSPLLSHEQLFLHRGIVIKGVDYLEQQGILTRKDVTELIDRLPDRYFEQVPLGEIDFEPYKMFSIEREGKVIYVKEDELRPTDAIIARKRGVTRWNSKMEDDIALPTDGKMTVKVFSPLNWDNKEDKQYDKDTALYSLAHELGHTIWQAVVYLPGIIKELNRLGVPSPCSQNITNLLGLITEWKTLPESQLQRYLDYKDVFVRENKSDAGGHLETTLDDLSKQEDFATSYEHFLYWRNLQNLDQQRFAIHKTIHDRIK